MEKPASWDKAALTEGAAKERTVTVYSSTNEEEGLALWALFERQTGLKVEYVRASDTQLLARIATEKRAGKDAWDVIQTTAVHKMPKEWLRPFFPPEADGLLPEARDPEGYWYGVYTNYNAPSYNTEQVRREDLPTTYEEFLDHPEWAGRIAIDGSDAEWIKGMFDRYGESRARDLLTRMRDELDIVITSGHIGLAEAIGSGEHLIGLNNYVNLTLNVKKGGAPIDFWAINPAVVFYGEVGVNAEAPHPNAALLAADFLLSRAAQEQLTTNGRIPTRPDVETNPPGLLQQFQPHPVILSAEEDKEWQKTFDELLVR